ncbi:hypothetical protein MHK_001384, partial [Candidatus Magnetomorum sp. HK-1]
HFCNKPECKKASKRNSQRKWLSKDENKDYFTGKQNVERVQEWRKKNPGYSKKKYKSLKESTNQNNEEIQFDKEISLNVNLNVNLNVDALQDTLNQNIEINQKDKVIFTENTLQDVCFSQPAVLIALIATLTECSLQDNFEKIIQKMQDVGLRIINYLYLNERR